MLDVMFYEAFEEERKQLKKYLPKDLKAKITYKTIQECDQKKPIAKVVSIRTQSVVPLDWAFCLEGVLSRSQGYDHLNKFLTKTKRDVPCGYLSNYCSRAVAEQAILLMMMLFRKAKTQERNFSKFFRDGVTGSEVKNKKALVVGVGNIGSQIVDIAKGLKMKVKGVDIKKKIKSLEYVSLSKGILWADILFCALSLTDKTRGMLNYEMLKKARKGLVFINIARGEIAQEKDLKRLLKMKALSGIGLDVYTNEDEIADILRNKKKKNQKVKSIVKLSEEDNVICFPHNAFNTVEAVDNKAKQTMDSLKHFFRKGKFLNQIKMLSG